MPKQDILSVDELINFLTIEEKIALVSGHNFMFTNAIKRLNIPSIRMSDGPHGLRVQNEGGDNGVNGSAPATCFPTASCSANTFNPELLEKMGNAIADECAYYGIDVLLGPGVNIKRNPLCGRNFEYFSEDPLLAGVMGASEVKGLQDKGVSVSVKHFALNNSENYRFMSNSICDMRAMREIYLKQYEYIVKNAKPDTLMCAYNQINGKYCSENKRLLTDILRNEWGFDGVVMTDWGAINNRVKAVKAGLDLEMPGDTAICRKWLYDSIKDGSLKVEELDFTVKNVLNLVNKHLSKRHLENVNWDSHALLAKEIALEGAVLLKNDHQLPLSKKESYLVVGELFEKMRYQGAGSSMINPTKIITPKDAFNSNHVRYKYLKGYKENELEVNQSLLDEVIGESKNYEQVLVFAGLTDYVESEGGDRENMSLPNNQLALINALIKENKKMVLVLYGGSVIELPFYENVQAILNMFLPGQSGGEATYELLFGLANPSGRLGETWPLTYNDVPFNKEYSVNKREIYKESIYVGYRYYLSANKEVRFPFGYGLSYTSFDYSDLKVKQSEKEIIATLKVKNVGEINGKETVQLYISAPRGNVHKPIRELRGLAKVSLKAHEEKEVTLSFNKNELSYWDIDMNRFVLEDGEYVVQIGRNSKDIILEEKIEISGEKLQKTSQKVYENLDFTNFSDDEYAKIFNIQIPELAKSKPITLESRFTDLKQTSLGRILFNAVLNVAKKDMKKAKKLPEGIERDNKIKGAIFLRRILETNSLRSMSMSASGGMPYNFACGFRDLANGHLIKGIKNFMKKIDAPELPSDKEENK